MYYNITECTPDRDIFSINCGVCGQRRRSIGIEKMSEIIDEMPLTPRYDTLPGKSIDNAKPRSTAESKSDIALMKALYSDINSLVNSYVMRIMDNYEYMESPIYCEEGIDRETLAQIVDGVIRLAEEETDEAEEIALEDGSEERWSRCSLLKNMIEAITLSEIFSVRRPNYKRVRDNYVYRNGAYDGVRAR